MKLVLLAGKRVPGDPRRPGDLPHNFRRISGIAKIRWHHMGMNGGPGIQVDMFEVQLGAALLLQFQTANGKTVRVLADGGRGGPVDIQKADGCDARVRGPAGADRPAGRHAL
jgi:hypothetical protein